MSTEIKRLQPQMIRITGASQNDILTVGNGTAEFTNNLYLSGVNVGTSAALAGRKLQVVGDTELSGSIFQSGNYIDVIATGNNLETQIAGNDADIATLTSNLVSTGNNLEAQITSTVAGNLSATGNALEAQIISNDTDIANLTTNLASTGSTLQSNLDTVESAAAASLVSTGNALDAKVDALQIVDMTDTPSSVSASTSDITQVLAGNAAGNGVEFVGLDKTTPLTSDVYTGDGSTSAFTMTVEPNGVADIMVSVNGLLQTPGDNYTVSGTTLTMSDNVPSGLALEVRHLKRYAAVVTGGGGGSTTFLGLQDSPASYTASKFLAVNSVGTAIEFVDAPAGGGGSSTFLGLTDSPASYTASKYLAVNSAGTALEFVDAPAGGGGSAGTGSAVSSSTLLTGDGSVSGFAMGINVDAAKDIMVSVNGLVQRPDVDYSLSNNTGIVFDAAPTSGHAIEIRHFSGQAGGGGGSASISYSKDVFTGDGTVSGFTMGRSVSDILETTVFINGLAQLPDENYFVSGTDLTFASGDISSGDVIMVRHMYA